MIAARALLFLGVAALVSAATVAQEPAKTGEDSKVRGQLPFYWKELGLSDEQRQKVYKINDDYKDQIEALEQKIKELKSKRDKERYEVLSPDQKKMLEKIIREKIGAGSE